MTPFAIRELRHRLRESQTHFGARFRVSQITIAHWESGRSQPTCGRLDELASLAAGAALAEVVTSSFRPIQYLGSKQRLAQTIANIVSESVPGESRVGDLFAGSGAVSSLLRKSRAVTSVDVQAFSSVLTGAILRGQAEHYEELTQPRFLRQVNELTREIMALASPLCEFEAEALKNAQDGNAENLIQLMEFGSVAVYEQRPLKDGPPRLMEALREVANRLKYASFPIEDLTATRYFGGPYFSYNQAIALDAFYIASKTLSGPGARGVALAVLLSTASEIVNTVGKQFAQPMKLEKPDGRVPPLLLKRALRDRTLDAMQVFGIWTRKWSEQIAQNGYDHRVVCGDVIDFVENDRDCKIFYADPPYTIDHYSRFYHVLETLVLRDAPGLDEMKKLGELRVMRGIYRKGRHQSSFCVPSLAPAAFEQLFAGTARRGAPLVLSYSPFDEQEGHRPRLLALPNLIAIAERYYSCVSMLEVTEHSHKKLNSRAQNTGVRSDAERILICKV